MRLKDVPVFPAYVVFHDAYMNGAMDVYTAPSLEEAQRRVTIANAKLEEFGADESGCWRAYEKLPRKKVWKFHAPKPISKETQQS